MARHTCTAGIFLLACTLALGFTAGTGMAASGAKKRPVVTEAVPITAHELLKRITAEKGKVVIVNVFASWCPPCREEIPGLIAIRNQFSDQELVLIGVSIDKAGTGEGKDKTPKALKKFMGEMSFNFPVYLAAPGFEATVGVTAVPQLLMYDRSGALVGNHKGLVNQDDLAEAIRTLLQEQAK